ncbi:MAG: EAL domain-containing protein [Gammaproteobacteria bacterium]
MRVAIDDFSTGYSSLRYLVQLPINVLKIDRSFVDAMTRRPDDMAIVSSIISLAQGLRFTTVAEGVETQEQRNLLRLLHCMRCSAISTASPCPRPPWSDFWLPVALRARSDGSREGRFIPTGCSWPNLVWRCIRISTELKRGGCTTKVRDITDATDVCLRKSICIKAGSGSSRGHSALSDDGSLVSFSPACDRHAKAQGIVLS